MQSIFISPNPLLFGAGSSKVVGEKLREMGCKKVLVIYDLGIKKSGVADRLISIIKESDVETVCFDEIVGETVDWSVEDAGALGVREKVDGVVGIGGGSAIDTAKAATLLLTNPPPISRYFGHGGDDTLLGKPLVVIPTTAGSGSEATAAAVITDTSKHVKASVYGAGCKVALAISDPELIVGMPPHITAASGVDAMCHAMGAYTSSMSNSFCDILARKAIRLAGKYLIKSYQDGTNLEAREGMMLASTLGGIAMSSALYHLVHDIAKVIGAKFHVAHGNACAFCLPQVLEVIAPTVPERVQYIAESLGASVPADAPPELIGAIARVTMLDMLKTLNMPSMKDEGLVKKDLLLVVPDGVMAIQKEIEEGFGQAICPVPVTKELVESIISKAYDEN